MPKKATSTSSVKTSGKKLLTEKKTKRKVAAKKPVARQSAEELLNEQKANLDAWHKKRVSMVMSTAFMTLGSIGGFALLGWLLDELTGKSPVFLITFVLLSFPVTQFALYKKAKAVAKKP